MSYLAPALGGHLAYRGPQRADGRQRMLAIGGVLALHGAVIGLLLIAQLKPPITPPEPTLMVSFVTEDSAIAAPTPPRPAPAQPPPPERQMLATASPTPSPMTAPPMEQETPREATPVAPAPPAPSAPSAPAAPSAAPATLIPPSFKAAYLNNPQPAYPQAALRRRIEGTVNLRVQVGTDGAPMQVLVDRTSGNRDLDTAAVDIVKRRWKFAPARQGDRAVTAWVIVPMEFYLKAA